MIADGTMYTLDGLQLTNADKIGVVNGLQSLMLFSNQLTSFNPAIDFPDLTVLIISQNQLSIFNPPVGLPVTMRYLDLNSNEMTTAAYTVMESWANSLLPFTSTCNVLLGGNTDSVSGTTLKTILESKNCTVSG
jgi:Leucine-rich repeat (LRR) protein